MAREIQPWELDPSWTSLVSPTIPLSAATSWENSVVGLGKLEQWWTNGINTSPSRLEWLIVISFLCLSG